MLAAAGLLAWGAGSAGAHGGDTSKVHSCIVPSSGYAQIIGANETCSKNYRALDWSATDTNTTYGAGFGLSLSSANVFSVTGAPWSGLTGVPAGFADGVDNVGAAATWSDLTGVPAGFADGVDDAGSMQWGDLTGVPLDLLDGDDDSSAALAQLVTRLSDGDGTPNESDDPVSFTKIKHLDSPAGGRILGSFIQDGTIQGHDLGTVVENVSTTATMGTVPAGTRSTITISVPGVRTNDLVTVSPPATLDDDLIFSGSDVLLDDVVTVYLYNPTANPIDAGSQTWKIRWLNTNG